MMSYIYVLKCNDSVKIGFSINVEKRLKSHQTSNPFVEFVNKYEAPKWVEKYLHKKLSHSLKSGCTEWFVIYDGIFSDIEKYIEEAKSKEPKTVAKQKTDEPIKVFKFKDKYRDDYAIVASRNSGRAFKIIMYKSAFTPEYVGELDANDFELIPNREYIIISSIRSELEKTFCNKYNIDFHKEYGITYKRIKALMVQDDCIVSETNWDKPMKKYVALKKYKNVSYGRKKRRFTK